MCINTCVCFVNQARKTALHLAVEKNFEGIATVLLEKGVDVDVVDAVCSNISGLVYYLCMY